MLGDYCFLRTPYLENTTGFAYIAYNGGIGTGNIGATAVYPVIPSFSI